MKEESNKCICNSANKFGDGDNNKCKSIEAYAKCDGSDRRIILKWIGEYCPEFDWNCPNEVLITSACYMSGVKCKRSDK